MGYETIMIEKEGSIVILTLNRPDHGNSFNQKMMREADYALRQIGDDHAIRAVIITGAGEYFCTGIDLSMFTGEQTYGNKKSSEKYFLPAENDEVYGSGTTVASVIRIKSMPKPVIAAVNGAAVGLGFSLALACDMMIASDKAKFSMVFVKRGIAPDAGGSFNLPRVVGLPRAFELALTGETIDAIEAERIGMVNRVIPHSNLLKSAKDLANKIAENPPLAVGKTKEMLYQSMAEQNMVEQMKREVELQNKLLKTADFREAATAFMEKRKPVFKGE
jgi:2-(1,2-epoxy-1,2-dihydrophenyl)acetyl-CoA isomerase